MARDRLSLYIYTVLYKQDFIAYFHWLAAAWSVGNLRMLPTVLCLFFYTFTVTDPFWSRMGLHGGNQIVLASIIKRVECSGFEMVSEPSYLRNKQKYAWLLSSRNNINGSAIVIQTIQLLQLYNYYSYYSYYSITPLLFVNEDLCVWYNQSVKWRACRVETKPNQTKLRYIILLIFYFI